eukprot:1253832-Pyramimonas_sp.AAC.1
MILDLGAGGNISATLEASILPPSPRSGSASLGGGIPPVLVLVSTSRPAGPWPPHERRPNDMRTRSYSATRAGRA